MLLVPNMPCVFDGSALECESEKCAETEAEGEDECRPYDLAESSIRKDA